VVFTVTISDEGLIKDENTRGQNGFDNEGSAFAMEVGRWSVVVEIKLLKQWCRLLMRRGVRIEPIDDIKMFIRLRGST